jgi:translation elongation factor EF-Tu-like GTPase
MELRIKNVGKMWHVCHGKTVLAFATSYPWARARADELKTTGAAARALQQRAAR